VLFANFIHLHIVLPFLCKDSSYRVHLWQCHIASVSSLYPPKGLLLRNFPHLCFMTMNSFEPYLQFYMIFISVVVVLQAGPQSAGATGQLPSPREIFKNILEAPQIGKTTSYNHSSHRRYQPVAAQSTKKACNVFFNQEMSLRKSLKFISVYIKLSCNFYH